MSDDDEVYEDFEDDFEDDEDLSPTPSPTKPSWVAAQREFKPKTPPKPAGGSSGIDDMLSNFDALLAGYKAEAAKPQVPIRRASSPETKTNAAQLDSLG